MFETLFQYPARVFAKGELVFLSGAPVWLLWLAILLTVGGLALLVLKRHGLSGLTSRRRWAIWGLQAALAGLLLTLLWQPALRVSALKQQQNVVAVLVDDSKSMALKESGGTREEMAKSTLDSGFLESLRKRYQVRLYRIGSGLMRIDSTGRLTAQESSTRLADSLKAAAAESATLPVGAMVLLSDGADNSGGIDVGSLAEIRRSRIPVHTIGYGREKLDRDLEITQADIPARSLKGARLAAQVTFRQRGYSGRKARLIARSDGKTLASREVVLKDDGTVQTESLLMTAGEAGPRTIEFSIEGLENEENPNNNALRRLVTVEASKPRVLYIEGEPRWEYKFLRRALEDDPSVSLVSILRTTQNKIYRQGVDPNNPKELEEGFPATAEELFQFQGLIIGGVEASYFTANQQEAIKLFADRRGGGVLFLAGRSGLADGGYGAAQFAEILPVILPDRKNTFHREPANVELTQAGRDSVITRLQDSPEKNTEAWKKLPYLANYQEVGLPKPGTIVLAEALPTSKGRFPLLAMHNFGRGRAAVLASGGTWRWKMLLDHEDRTHPTFWQQLMRWLVTDSPTMVSAVTQRQVLSDERVVPLRAEIRNKAYLPVSDASVEARVTGPDGAVATVPLALDPLSEGVYTANWEAEKPGPYVVEVVARRAEQDLGHDVFNFRREDGVAENFGLEQNRELLEKLSSETGGKYYKASDANRLLDEISFSDAGITVRENFELWNMPIIFLLILGLCAAEWLLRRKWGIV
jgi:uncharacterized membrane protein